MFSSILLEIVMYLRNFLSNRKTLRVTRNLYVRRKRIICLIHFQHFQWTGKMFWGQNLFFSASLLSFWVGVTDTEIETETETNKLWLSNLTRKVLGQEDFFKFCSLLQLFHNFFRLSVHSLVFLIFFYVFTKILSKHLPLKLKFKPNPIS